MASVDGVALVASAAGGEWRALCPGLWVAHLGFARPAQTHPAAGWFPPSYPPTHLPDSFKSSPGGFPGGAVVKNPPANAGDMGSISGLGRSHMLRSS